MFIGKYNKSVILTYLGATCSVLAIHFAFSLNMKMAMICMILAGVCDLFDGKVARMCKRDNSEKNFGIQIDSLADIFSYVAVPIFIGYALGLNSLLNLFSYICIVLAGIIRLAYFNITIEDNSKPVKNYSGLPVTSTSAAIPLAWFICSLTNKNCFLCIYPYILILIAFLFIFNFKIPKFKGKAYIILSLIAALGVILLLLI